MTAAALERLTERVLQEGPPLVVRERPEATGAAFAGLVVGAPRTIGREEDYALVVEAVREGYLCHYGRSRVLADPDPDLALLAGDLFYAIGISGLAALDDLESTGILSDLIRVAAELQAASQPDLAETLWLGQIVALACGKDDRQEAAITALEAGDSAAASALESWAREQSEAHGLGRAFDLAQSAIDSRPSNS